MGTTLAAEAVVLATPAYISADLRVLESGRGGRHGFHPLCFDGDNFAGVSGGGSR
ncbi:MAG: hypothetical protein U0361_09110 [Nitrospiraceae bacterium]